MARLGLSSLSLWVTTAAVEHPQNLTTAVVQRTGMARSTACKVLKQLVELNWLMREGTRQRPIFRPGMLRQVVRRYPLAGLAADTIWARDFAPFFALSAAVSGMTRYTFCELLDNAIKHSDGTVAMVALRQTASHVQLLVSDDGRGMFDKIQQSLALDDPQQAMLELSKGKLTSQSKQHSGRGLLITSKLADVFDLHANQAAFQHREWVPGQWLPSRPLKRRGTAVYAAIALDTTRTLESVLNTYSVGPTRSTFERIAAPWEQRASPVATGRASQSAGLSYRRS